MTSAEVIVDCAQGYTRAPFPTRKAAERWIASMAASSANNPRMCAGPHTIREEARDGEPGKP